MLGVVVWSSEKRNKAVIWCEDQGALAYLAGMHHVAAGTCWPAAGDLVELDCISEGGLRVATNLRLLSAGAGAALPHALRAQVRLHGPDQVEPAPVLVDAASGGVQAANGMAGCGAAPQPRTAAAASCA